MFQTVYFLGAIFICLEVAQAQIGLVCTKNSDCKMSSSFVCGPKNSCVCDRGHRFDFFQFSCQRHLVNQKDRCDPNQDICKGGSNAICQSTFLGERPSCKCKQGYIYDASTELCQLPRDDFNTEGVGSNPNPGQSGPPPSQSGALPGQPCNTNSDCRFFPNATCYYFVDISKRECNCNYDTYYFDSISKTCLPKKQMGSTCEIVDECVNLSNIECSNGLQNTNTRTCTCKMDYYYNRANQVCTPTVEIGEGCQNDEQCKARPNSRCSKVSGGSSGRCDCIPGKMFVRSSRTCVEDPSTGLEVSNGHPCMPESKCQGGANAVCKNTFIGMNPVCTCKDGYLFDSASKLCTREGTSSNSGGTSPSEPHGNGNEINIDLKFNVLLQIICDRDKRCKAAKAHIQEST
ncbi:unnamed protein product [Allacma fusca]|uniref:EGF-like domain-containing protein n=1 Tax=Allacma fusca TaxID=39272 RepID=A0A8J2JHP6_9HEXA|nr:unnamed protein product [Allacma fusca]